MHPSALPSCFLLETRALPADAERVVYSMALDAHDAPAGRAANRDGVRAEAIADVLRPDDILNRTSSDLSEPAALGTDDHGTCLAASCSARAIGRAPDNKATGALRVDGARIGFPGLAQRTICGSRRTVVKLTGKPGSQFVLNRLTPLDRRRDGLRHGDSATHDRARARNPRRRP
jgi:hypothetical protein